MKNLFLTAAILLAFAANAQTEATTVTTPAPAAQAASNNQTGYTSVKQSEIAPEVLKQAVEKYKGYALVEALVAIDKSNYKLVLTKDGKDVAVYYKLSGEFIKEETV